MDQATEVREFWFGQLPLTPEALEERMRFWFEGSASDELIRERFGALMQKAAMGELAAWADSPRRRLSLILLLDQFPRNVYRGRARAFATDAQALQLALSGMQSGADAALDPVERIFFYMPLQHSETLEVQDEAVAAFRRLMLEAPSQLRPAFAECLEFAEQHRNIVLRFGRFPYRNRVLGRESTADELAYLEAGGQSFGQ